jgi:hypothetical protein
MAVTPYAKDTDGVLLQSNITALTAQIAKMTSTLTKEAMSAQLLQLQRELVLHYLGVDVNRLNPATILSTLS